MNRDIPKVLKFLSIFILSLFLFNISIRAQEENIDLLLEMDIQELTNIDVITASKTLTKISNVPATVRVITKEQIKKRGFLTLENALSDLPGFQFRNINGFNSYIFQRGITCQNNLTLVLVDGIQINELNSGGFYGGAQFNLENVERIEVVYGPASALYGTNAISGIINIITRDPENSRGLRLSSSAGSFNTYNGSLSWGYYDETEKFGINLSGFYKTSEKADLAGDEGDNNWTEKLENFEDDLGIDLKAVYKDFTLGLNYQRKMASRSTNYKSVGTDYLDYGSSWNISFLNLYLKHNYYLDNDITLNSKIYFRDATVLDNTIGYVLDTLRSGYYRPNSLTGAEETITWNISENISLVGGAIFESEKLATSFSRSYSNSSDVDPPAPEKPDMETNSLFSLYLQPNIKFLKYFNLYAGIRFDNSSVYDQVVTPRAGLIFNKDKFTGKLLYAEAFRAPKPWDYTSGLGNADLEPEKLKSLEFSFSYSPAGFLLLDASLYRNVMDEKLTQIYMTDGWRWDNHGSITVEGLELQADFRKDPLAVFVNYTWNYSVDDNSVLLPEIARHTANFGFEYKIMKNLLLGVRNNYSGERINPRLITATNDNIIEAALVTNLYCSVENIRGFNFRFFINNLADVEYYHTSNRPPDRYRQPQRFFMLKIEYNLFSN